jgi:hypothetical protein
MSAHRIATAIEDEAAAFCRRRFTCTADYLEEKDAHCKRIQRLVRDLRRAIGVPEQLSLGTGRRQFGRVSFDVIHRTRAPKRA